MEHEKKALAAKVIEKARVILSDLPESPEIQTLETNDYGSFTSHTVTLKLKGVYLRVYLQEDKAGA